MLISQPWRCGRHIIGHMCRWRRRHDPLQVQIHTRTSKPHDYWWRTRYIRRSGWLPESTFKDRWASHPRWTRRRPPPAR